MNHFVFLIVLFVYFGFLFLVSKYTSKSNDNDTFFLGNKSSSWYMVAFGMIGTSLSGITFISVPGWVEASQFSYMQMVLGYLIGYTIIATVLMPIYYRLNLTSIYEFLGQRIGEEARVTGSAFFLVSRIIGASLRLYIVAMVLQLAIFDSLGIPFAFTVLLSLMLIWLYTYRGGIKTIVLTDTLQTFFMLLAVALTIVFVKNELNVNWGGLIETVRESQYSQIFFFDGGWSDSKNFFKKFLGGASIAIVMTGLDQDMMQKNLSCKNIGDAQKNMFWFSIILVFANLVFLSLGALLFICSDAMGIAAPEKADELFPNMALSHMNLTVGIVFFIGLLAAAYSSADSALTSLTTSFTVDILKQKDIAPKKRYLIHFGFTMVLFFVIMMFYYLNDDSAIWSLFKLAGYTYGPLLGMFCYSLWVRKKIAHWAVLFVCLVAPALTYIINANSEAWFAGYKFDFEHLLVNGFITFIGLVILSFFIPQKNDLNQQVD